MNKAVFLDKDGTLIQDVPYNVHPDAIWLMPGAITGLKRLHKLGYKLIVITNQAGVAHGYFSERALRQVEEHLHWLLSLAGIPLTGFYYCPHHREGALSEYAVACDCRKPEPGLILRAADDHDIDCGRSWMVGDILHDVEAGQRAGCRTILINNGGETEWQLSENRLPQFMAGNLVEVARIITAHNELEPGKNGLGRRELSLPYQAQLTTW